LTVHGALNTIDDAMRVTIDAAGRLVVPKDIRDQAHLEAGAPLEIRFRDGRIEIEPAPRQVEIVKRGRLRVAVATGVAAPLTAEAVRRTRDRVRDR
jgi:AbrB family looped-hinge helix DNA binding protein